MQVTAPDLALAIRLRNRRERVKLAAVAEQTVAGCNVKLSILFGTLVVALTTMRAPQARAEDVWTCTQPSATDSKPIQSRYMVSTATNKIFDEFNLPWTILANDDRELVAAMTMSGVPAMGRLLVIDVRTGNMTLAIVHLQSPDAPSRFFNGTCAKD